MIEVVLDWSAGEVAGCDYVWNFCPVDMLCAFCFGQVHFEEIIVTIVEAVEGNESLDGAGTFGPAAAHTASEGDDGELAGEEGLMAGEGVGWSGLQEVCRPDVFDVEIGRQYVFGEANTVGQVVGAQSIMSLRIEAERVQEAIDFVVVCGVALFLRKESLKEGRGEIGIASGDTGEFCTALAAQV